MRPITVVEMTWSPDMSKGDSSWVGRQGEEGMEEDRLDHMKLLIFDHFYL